MNIPVFSKTSNSKTKELEERVTTLEAQIIAASEFVKEIEKGNLNVDYKYNEESDTGNALSASLISLRNQLKNYAVEEKERNWVTEGLARFIDILRSKNNDMNELTDDIIRNLIKYLGANQGALYIIDDNDAQDIYLEIKACYAFERKKYINQRINIGEGLAGQAVMEKETIYMTEIPDSYLRITSGLGEGSARNLLIVPLKLDDQVLGVLEIASFSIFKKYQIEFVERLGESIASTVKAVKINQRTNKLLQDTQAQTQQLREQEEEVRQNMEELSATQEEMKRVLNQAQEKESYLNELINVPKDSIITVDKNFKIISYNRAFSAGLEAMTGKMDFKGFDYLSLFPDQNEKLKQKTLFERAFAGENFEETNEYDANGVKSYYTMNLAPIYSKEGEIIAVACFGKDVTALMSAQKQTEQLLSESRQKSEELLAQEEELRQNMEELSTTQEEMERILNEVREKESYLTELINVPKDTIFTVDRDYRVLSYNKSFSMALEAFTGNVDLKGFPFLDLFPSEAEKQKQIALYERAFNGENFEITNEYDDNNGGVIYITTNLAPLHDKNNKIFAVASFGKDITKLIAAQKQSEKLLGESELKSKELLAQEEELRQNMEELSATQEEMQRILEDVRRKEQYLKELINVPKDSIFTVDKNYCIIDWNKSFAEGLEAAGITDLKGFDLMNLFQDEKAKQNQIEVYQRAFKGENFEIITEYPQESKISYYASNYAPLRNDAGEIFAVACFSKDVTELMTVKKNNKK
ncbi:pas sensor protein [Sporocytophaga myxococcoides]|uniref:histidine kinase n=1 Tax=Sporocytophaga myxococcoides TaxID=153721 RepID=A0A098LHE7_9BACT|nr:PAS domain-containing protein [Sporocytophaga myxococcoides]GAL86365.1 pas sensor protein [Sporocytophaga myxococcoides]